MAKEVNSDAPHPGSVPTEPIQATPPKPGCVNRENAEHYRWGIDCDGWHLVKSKDLSVIEEFMPPGAAEVRHHHQHAQQFFYVVEGEILMEVNGDKTLVGAG